MKKLFAIAMVLTLCIGALSICSFAAEDTFTVYVTIDSETAPNAWAWGDYGNAFSAWPGVPMEQDGEYWKIEVPMGTTGFIANNGTAQTADIKISGTGDAYITVSADFATYEVTADGEGTVEPPVDPQPPVEGGENIPTTGDMGLTAVAVALFAATAGLVVTLTKKED